MKLLFALGNIGKQYEGTRHNVGFFVLDSLAQKNSASFQTKTKFSAEIAETNIDGEKVIFAKPTTFYNDAGIAARAIMDFYKLSLDDILVIHDDIVLDFGKIRVRRGGENAGNNGLKSLHQHIGKDFWHIRIGADSLLRRQIGDTDFVLSRFNSDEQKILNDWTIPESLELIRQFLAEELEATSVKL